MRRAFRAGHGVYDDGQSSWSVNCQEARRRGRLPMTAAVKLVRALMASKGVKVTIAQARNALRDTHDGEWHHTSKYGNRTPYYDPQAAVARLSAVGRPADRKF
jgi:spore germination protein YaaH